MYSHESKTLIMTYAHNNGPMSGRRGLNWRSERWLETKSKLRLFVRVTSPRVTLERCRALFVRQFLHVFRVFIKVLQVIV
jgi:hypothetical protein